MKRETVIQICKQFKTLRTVVKNYSELYPFNTVLISIEVALQNIHPYAENVEDRIHKTVKFIDSVYQHTTNDHFIHYIKDEVEMIVTGNEMSEYYEDNITSTYGELKANIKEFNGFQIIDNNGKLWVKEDVGDLSNEYYNSEPKDDDIYCYFTGNK